MARTATAKTAAAKRAATEESDATFETVAKESAMKANESILKGYEDVAGQGKEMLDAMTESGRATAEIFEEIGTRATEFMRARVEDGMGAAREMASCKDLNDALALQAASGQRFFDALLTEGRTVSELSAKAFSKAVEPMSRYAGSSMTRMFNL